MTEISPTTFNIHMSEALEDACFLDLLIPDYPDNVCSSYEVLEQNENTLLVKNIGDPNEDILDLNMMLA